MKFIVHGEPMGKERPRYWNGHMYTPKKTAEYERLVKREFEEQVNCGAFPTGTPLSVTVDAFYKIPKGATKKQKERMMANLDRPTKKPDFDNIGKIICDSLNGLAYSDDCQIVDASVHKYYSADPRVEVTIEVV